MARPLPTQADAFTPTSFFRRRRGMQGSCSNSNSTRRVLAYQSPLSTSTTQSPSTPISRSPLNNAFQSMPDPASYVNSQMQVQTPPSSTYDSELDESTELSHSESLTGSLACADGSNMMSLVQSQQAILTTISDRLEKIEQWQEEVISKVSLLEEEVKLAAKDNSGSNITKRKVSVSRKLSVSTILIL